MGSHCCGINSEVSGSSLHPHEPRAKTPTQRSVKALSSELKVRTSKPPGNSYRFEAGRWLRTCDDHINEAGSEISEIVHLVVHVNIRINPYAFLHFCYKYKHIRMIVKRSVIVKGFNRSFICFGLCNIKHLWHYTHNSFFARMQCKCQCLCL